MSLHDGLLLSNALRRRCRGDDAICSLRHRELKQGQENLLPTRALGRGFSGVAPAPGDEEYRPEMVWTVPLENQVARVDAGS